MLKYCGLEALARRVFERMDASHQAVLAVEEKGSLHRTVSEDTGSTCENDRKWSDSSLESDIAAFDSRSFVQYHLDGAGIESRYQIDINQIASGGYGKVYKAADKQCKGRVVAIKKVLGSDESTASQYMKEAQIMQELDHPGICKLFEVYQENDTLFFVLEFLGGGDLFDRIISEQMSEAQIGDILRQVACALKYAHSCGVAHRDLKPENICVCSHDTTQVKVIDWGLSSDFCKGKMKSAVGSAAYSAPEVSSAKGQVAYTSACDLWSLGVMTYVMICGKPPFWGSYTLQMKKMMAEQYPMQDGVWPQVSESAKDFIRRLLKADPRNRMTTDEALSHAFLIRRPEDKVDMSQMQLVLSNIVTFSASQCFSPCMTSAARQLSHSQENTIRKVFMELDADNDGVLQLPDVVAAFSATFGEDSVEVQQSQHIFSKLDLDRTGTLAYTEFCIAAMGSEICKLAL